MSQKFKTTPKPSPKPSPKNTLFNYFKSNTPKTDEKNEESETKIEKQLTGKQLDFGEYFNLLFPHKLIVTH